MQLLPKMLIKPIEQYFVNQYDLATFLSIVSLTTNNLQNNIAVEPKKIVPVKKKIKPNENEEIIIPQNEIPTYIGQGIFKNIVNNKEFLQEYSAKYAKYIWDTKGIHLEILKHPNFAIHVIAYYWNKQQLFKFKGHLQSLQNVLKFDTIDTFEYTTTSNLYQNYLSKE